MKWPSWNQLLDIFRKPTPYIKPKCPICGKDLNGFPGSELLMCENGHKFGPGMERVDLINDGTFHGEL